MQNGCMFLPALPTACYAWLQLLERKLGVMYRDVFK